MLLAGEAGVGKTVFLREFCRRAAGRAKVLIGACDPLSTPRPLGPLLDMASVLGGDLERLLLNTDQRDLVFRKFLSTLAADRRPHIVVFEDVHWADEATLDLLRFLGRRLASTRTLLIASYRDEEVGPRHPFRVVIGDLATSSSARRLVLSPLSERAVGQLAEESGIDSGALYRQTGGNSFYVTEVLASGTAGVPPTVRDAVLARAARLSPQARAVLEAAAVIGSRIELWLLERVLRWNVPALDECLEAGMLQAQDATLAFRHELAREAVLDTLSPQLNVIFHRQVLEVLRSSGSSDFVRLSHHAEAAADRQAVLEYAPAAARRAAKLCAHREAAALYARALRFADGVPPAERALLLGEYAQECALTNQLPETIRAEQEAVRLWQRDGNRLKEGEALSLLADSLLAAGRNAEAAEVDQAALDVLEPLDPSAELAAAYASRATLCLLNGDNDHAIIWGRKAISLAEQLDDKSTLIVAYSRVGTAMLQGSDGHGYQYLEQSLALAIEVKSDACTAMSYLYLAAAACEDYQFAVADRNLDAGVSYCLERDIDTARLYMTAWKALSMMQQGCWNEAAQAALSVMKQRRSGIAPYSYITVLITLGRIRTRRGDPEAADLLEEALKLASQTGTLKYLGPVRATRAEAAWLAGDQEKVVAETDTVLQLAIKQEHVWSVGELAYWRWKAGALESIPASAATPYALQMAGQWREAAEQWQRLNCPYESARALSEGDDEGALKQALQIFEELGARPAATAIARRLRELGARGIPRGPRPATRAHPARLTAREVEVLQLLHAGFQNAEIARKLQLSTKTAGHHVSSILAKLGVRSRTEAVREAIRLALVQSGEAQDPNE